MDETVSRRVKILRFPLILMVLYIHSFIGQVNFHNTVLPLAASPGLVALQTAWSNGFARTAVPVFFLMSGYLYFIGFNGTVAEWRMKTWRRIPTLVVPYILWNALVLSLFAIGQRLPATAPYFNAGQGLMTDATPLTLLDQAFGFTHYPIVYPFWFIRDLFVMILFTPVMAWLLARSGVVLPVVLLAWWGARLPFLPIPSIEGVAFFVSGAWIARRGLPLFPPASWLRAVLPLYAVVLTADVVQRLANPDAQWFFTLADAIGVVLVLTIVSLVDRYKGASTVLVTLSSASFFVYAAHEPLMTMTRKLIYHAVPPSTVANFCVYLLLPLLIATVLTGLYFVLRELFPAFTAIISGGR